MSLTLNDIPEKSTLLDKYSYKTKIDNITVNFRCYHFFSEYFKEMSTSVDAEYSVNDFHYVFKKRYDSKMSLENFDIEFNNDVRKFEKIISYIIKNYDCEEKIDEKI